MAGAVFAQLIVALSVLFSTAGSSNVFKVVGDSVQLEIKESASEFDDFFWTFNTTVNILKYYKNRKEIIHSPRYKDRVKFNNKTCSLILKNLQKNDSGPYEVKASNALQTPTATYRLSVLDPVEPPVLTVYNTTDPCNITLTCRGDDLSINSTCYKKTCEEKEVTSPAGVALSLSVRNSIIICNHSNPASWKQENIIIALTHLCAHTDPVEPPVLTLYNTTDPCNITLTCRGHDLSINSSCYRKTCEEKNVTSPGGVALSLSVQDSIIICNHSNPVSWKQENITFTELCAHTEPLRVHSGLNWTGILITVGILVLLVVGYLWIKQRGSADSRQMEMEDTVYTEGDINDHPSSRETREETDSNEYSPSPQYPVSNRASGHNTDIMEPVPASVTVEPEYTTVYPSTPESSHYYEYWKDEPTSSINDQPSSRETREEMNSNSRVQHFSPVSSE